MQKHEVDGILTFMTDKLSDTVTRAWVRLLRARHAVVSAVEADGKAAGALPMEWYDVLWDLERHEEGVRPFELEQRLLFAQYNLSRIIDRLVEAGLVKRVVCPHDKRGPSQSCIRHQEPGERRRRSDPSVPSGFIEPHSEAAAVGPH